MVIFYLYKIDFPMSGYPSIALLVKRYFNIYDVINRSNSSTQNILLLHYSNFLFPYKKL